MLKVLVAPVGARLTSTKVGKSYPLAPTNDAEATVFLAISRSKIKSYCRIFGVWKSFWKTKIVAAASVRPVFGRTFGKTGAQGAVAVGTVGKQAAVTVEAMLTVP